MAGGAGIIKSLISKALTKNGDDIISAVSKDVTANADNFAERIVSSMSGVIDDGTNIFRHTVNGKTGYFGKVGGKWQEFAFTGTGEGSALTHFAPPKEFGNIDEAYHSLLLKNEQYASRWKPNKIPKQDKTGVIKEAVTSGSKGGSGIGNLADNTSTMRGMIDEGTELLNYEGAYYGQIGGKWQQFGMGKNGVTHMDHVSASADEAGSIYNQGREAIKHHQLVNSPEYKAAQNQYNREVQKNIYYANTRGYDWNPATGEATRVKGIPFIGKGARLKRQGRAGLQKMNMEDTMNRRMNNAANNAAKVAEGAAKSGPGFFDGIKEFYKENDYAAAATILGGGILGAAILDDD